MIRCIPKGICSWDFDLESSEHSASVEFNWVGEEGTIRMDGHLHRIEKHGVFSGQWTMEESAQTVATAKKSSAFTRSFDLTTPAGTITMRAESAFGRTMILKGPRFDGTITPVHPFTRRAMITGQISDFRMACFAFWLTVLLWRRAAQSD